MKWFKHDSDAHTDAKLKKVKMKYGLAGYGLYWHCLELICSGIDKTHLTFELEHDAEIIAFDTGIHVDLVSEMMTYMVNLDLFENTDGRITCLKMAKRLDQSMTSNPNMRNLIDQVRQNHDGIMTESCKKRIDKIRIDKNKDTLSPKVNNPVPYAKILDLYHKTLNSLPRVEKLTTKRKSYIKQRWLNDLPDLNHWENFFDYVSQSDFLMGKASPAPGRRVFKANLEWLTNESNFAKISEDFYHG